MVSFFNMSKFSVIRFNLFILFQMFLIVSCQAQTISKSPRDKYVRPGENAEFECFIENYNPSQDFVEWCKNDFCTWGRLIEKPDQSRLQFKSLPKYFLTGNRLNGDWRLLIENVTESEIGEYKCTLTHRGNQSSKSLLKIESKPVQLGLMKKPSSVFFEPSATTEILVGRMRSFYCKVKGGVPRPVFAWNLNHQNRKFKQLNETEFLIENSTNESAENLFISRIDLVGALDMQSKSLSCSVEHPMLDRKFIQSIDLDIKYEPVLRFNVEPSDVLRENQTVNFSCDSISRPETSEPIFIYLTDIQTNQRSQLSENGSVLLKLTRDLNLKILSCKHQNSIGVSVLNKTLNILYAPQFISKPPRVIQLNHSQSSLKINCEVDSNPPAQITWYRNDVKISTESQLDIRIAPFENENSTSKIYAEYTCKTLSREYPQIQTKTSLITIGQPSFTGELKNLVEKNKDLTMRLTISSNPAFFNEPVCSKLVSTWNNSRFFSNKERYEIVKESVDDESDQLLAVYLFRIKSVSEEDLGNYNCTVSNSLGEGFFQFEIELKTNNRKFLIALSVTILILVILFVLIIAIVVLIVKIRAKNTAISEQDSLKIGDSSSTYVKTSPSLSVSEWITNNSMSDKTLNEDKISQCEIFFDGKTLNTLSVSNFDSLINKSRSSLLSANHVIEKKIFNYDSIAPSSIESQAYLVNAAENKNLNPYSWNVNYYTTPSFTSPSLLSSSKLQTNV